MNHLGLWLIILQQTSLDEHCTNYSPLTSGSTTSRTEGLRHFLYIARAIVDRRLVYRPMA